MTAAADGIVLGSCPSHVHGSPRCQQRHPKYGDRASPDRGKSQVMSVRPLSQEEGEKSTAYAGITILGRLIKKPDQFRCPTGSGDNPGNASLLSFVHPADLAALQTRITLCPKSSSLLYPSQSGLQTIYLRFDRVLLFFIFLPALQRSQCISCIVLLILEPRPSASGLINFVMPQERRRKAADLAVPGKDDDSAERKRVLNVLAQRRYRKRKREHLQQLESKLHEQPSSNDPNSRGQEDQSVTSKESSTISSDNRSLQHFTVAQSPSTCKENPHRPEAGYLIDSHDNPYRVISGSTAAWESTVAIENPMITPSHRNPPNYAIDLGYEDMPEAVLATPVSALPTTSLDPPVSILSPAGADLDLPEFDFEPDCTYFDGGLAGVSWTTLSGFIPQPSSRHGRLRTPPFIANDQSTDTGTSSSSSSSAGPTPNSLPDCLHQDPDLESVVQLHRLQHFTFEDSYCLRVLELDLLRGAVEIAKRLNISDVIWSLHETSPFSNPANAHLTYDHLPLNLRPTTAQRTLPHHPVLDILPWPTARNKLIHVFSVTPDLRPPGARCPTALMDFVYDIEDSAEGVRIWGDDPCDWQNWEVGEKVFGKWWWAFDGDIIKNSNDWRINRGAPVLGQVLGEVC